MGGSSIAYHLRPHKAVDRRLFFDLLTRFQRWKSLSDAVYISMGAFPLEDHRLAHRILGLTRLIAFDREETVVARQRFNKPIESCHCLCKTSDEVVSDLDGILKDCGFPNPERVVVWLDYTDPKQIGEQVREFQTLIGKLNEGDFVRVTVNANPKELAPVSDTGAALVTKTMRNQFDQIKLRIGDYLPSSASPADMTSEGLSLILAQAFASASLKALPFSGDIVFAPLSIVRYTDTTQMLSISGALVHKKREKRVRRRLGMSSWPFSSENWSDIRNLVVPSLTLRERLFLEREITEKNDEEIIDALGFSSAGEIDIKIFLESYKRYYRFYPTILPVEL